MKHLIKGGLLIMALGLTLWGQSNMGQRSLSPRMASSYSNSATFSNPTELLMNRQYIGVQVNMSAINNRSGFQLFGHAMDVFGMGDFAFTFDMYGSDLVNNLTLVEKTVPCRDNPNYMCRDTSLSLIKSGTKYTGTWAKQLPGIMSWLSVGAQFRYYSYDNLLNSSEKRQSYAGDIGVYIAPIEEIYFGFAVRNMGGSNIKDRNGRDIKENGQIQTIPQSSMLSLGIAPQNRAYGLALGMPVDGNTGLTGDWIQFVKQTSLNFWFPIADEIAITTGYNTRDFYLTLDYQMNAFFGVTISASKQAVESSDSFVSFALNIGWFSDEHMAQKSQGSSYDPRFRNRNRGARFD